MSKLSKELQTMWKALFSKQSSHNKSNSFERLSFDKSDFHKTSCPSAASLHQFSNSVDLNPYHPASYDSIKTLGSHNSPLTHFSTGSFDSSSLTHFYHQGSLDGSSLKCDPTSVFEEDVGYFNSGSTFNCVSFLPVADETIPRLPRPG